MNDPETNRPDPSPKDKFQQEFEQLPLDEKFSKLFRMEVATLSETIDYVVNQPMKVVEKVGDVISDIGTKIEREARRAAESAKATANCPPTEPPSAESKTAGPRERTKKPRGGKQVP